MQYARSVAAKHPPFTKSIQHCTSRWLSCGSVSTAVPRHITPHHATQQAYVSGVECTLQGQRRAPACWAVASKDSPVHSAQHMTRVSAQVHVKRRARLRATRSMPRSAGVGQACDPRRVHTRVLDAHAAWVWGEARRTPLVSHARRALMSSTKSSSSMTSSSTHSQQPHHCLRWSFISTRASTICAMLAPPFCSCGGNPRTRFEVPTEVAVNSTCCCVCALEMLTLPNQSNCMSRSWTTRPCNRAAAPAVAAARPQLSLYNSNQWRATLQIK